MPAFTFVADYLGGTHLSQFKAADVDVAVSEFYKSLPTEYIPELSPGDEFDKCVRIDGLEACWCTGALTVDDELLQLHIIQTEMKEP